MAAKSFDHEFATPKSAATIQRELIQTWTGQLAKWGYDLTSQSDVGVTYGRTYRPWWVIAIAICLFPIGLLALLVTETSVITATIEPDVETGGSVLIVNGTGPKKVRDGFERLEV